MPPTVVLIRHAQAKHNATDESDLLDWSIPDPPLTEFGIQQCKELQTHLKQHLPVAEATELIVVSPMRRTLQTAQEGLGWLLDKGVSVQPRGEWQENSDKPCDTGTSTKTLAKEYPNFNFSTVFPEWPSKNGKWAFSESAITQRGIECRRWLKTRPEKVIIVVSHSAFLRTAINPTKYANADYRVFDFAETGDELIQWSLTEDGGGGMGRSPREPYYHDPADFTLESFDKESEQHQISGEGTKTDS